MLPYIHLIIPSYGLLAFIGSMVCMFFLFFQLDNFQIKFSSYLKLIVASALGCCLGSKLLYCIVMIPNYSEDITLLGAVVFYLQSGYVFYGGLLGTLFAIYLVKKHDFYLKDKNVYQFMSPVFPLFHAFGRIGCFMAGCCYGVKLSDPIIVMGMIQLNRVPTQLIESLFEFALFGVILFLYKKRKKHLLTLYLCSYAIFRFFLEFFRDDTDRGFWVLLSTSQWISVVILLIVLGRELEIIKRMKAFGYRNGH